MTSFMQTIAQLVKKIDLGTTGGQPTWSSSRIKKGCGLKTGHTYRLPTSATGGPEAQKRRFLAATVA